MNETYEEEEAWERKLKDILPHREGHKDIVATNYLVPPETTHLMTWFGGALPEKRRILNLDNDKDRIAYFQGDAEHVNYVKTLQCECGKIAKNGGACILVYDSKMLTNKQDEQKLKNVVDKIDNCFLVDYEDFIESVKKKDANSSKEFIEFINGTTEMIKNKPQLKNISDLVRGNFGDLIDCARIALLCKPGILKNLAIQKNENKDGKELLNVKDFSLLYRDFDVIQKKDIDDENKKLQNISTTENCIFFSKPTKYHAASKLENGVIFANSINNSNEKIEKMIKAYIKHPFRKCLPKDSTMYSVNRDVGEYVNDFTTQFNEEGHRTWVILDKGEEKINNRPHRNRLQGNNINLHVNQRETPWYQAILDIFSCNNCCETCLENERENEMNFNH